MSIRTHPSGMSVELLNSMGNDLSIVNAARVSYGKESEYEKYRYDPVCQKFEKQTHFQHNHAFRYSSQPLPNLDWHLCLSLADAGLLNYLMKNKHGTPFEMVQFQFRVHCPIGVAREWFRHRIGSFNEQSTRYVVFEKDYYTPQPSEWRAQVGKAGHYTYEILTDGSEHAISVEYELAMEKSFGSYARLLELGLAKEVARNVLPLGTITTFIWSVNLRSLLNFLALRTDSHALKEIQICANMVQELASAVVPESFNAWRRHGKLVP